jgi:hypothetical protein
MMNQRIGRWHYGVLCRRKSQQVEPNRCSTVSKISIKRPIHYRNGFSRRRNRHNLSSAAEIYVFPNFHFRPLARNGQSAILFLHITVACFPETEKFGRFFNLVSELYSLYAILSP